MIGDLLLYDSMLGRKEIFRPLRDDEVSIYCCGPTVYNKPHLGNLRSVMSYDVLVRVLQELYGKVKYARNITDVDDKIVNAAAAENTSTMAIASKYLEIFHKDVDALSCLRPSAEPKVTDYIPDIIAIIERLLINGNAYVGTDGVYFRVDSFPEYGRLSGRNTTNTKPIKARIASNEHKQCSADFALWKLYNEGSVTWPSPWGDGRPGWHIECSAMAHKELGENFDIHCGGEDLKFPHHENEIAQSVCAFPGSKFARYWLHTAFVTFGGEKMSKSIGNVCYLDEVLTPRINHEVVRYALLSTHYRKPIHLGSAVFEGAREAIDRIYDVIWRNSSSIIGEIKLKESHPFWVAIMDDLNTPAALAAIHNMVTAANTNNNPELLGNIIWASNLLGLLRSTPEQWFKIDYNNREIVDLMNQRLLARTARDFVSADKIKDILKKKGVEVMDHSDGTSTWRR